MSDFKLLAIRPLKGCNRRFVKNLTPGQLYPLYNSYKFFNDAGTEIKNVSNERICSIGLNINFPVGIFNRETADGHPLAISISAIVGKNGTGKSSLMELFFACVYFYAVHHNILKPNIPSLRQSTTELDAESASLLDRQKKITQQRNRIIKELNAKDNKIDVGRFDQLKTRVEMLLHCR
jgi:hypothetical protein